MTHTEKHGWIITQVNPDAGLESSEIGTMGPFGMTANKEEIRSNGQYFRMLDDDGIVYYHGYNLGNDVCAPLDHFGRPNAGCVNIQYKTGCRWKSVC